MSERETQRMRETPPDCEFCGRGFWTERARKAHLARAHKAERVKRASEYESDETTGLAGHPDGPGERW